MLSIRLVDRIWNNEIRGRTKVEVVETHRQAEVEVDESPGQKGCQ